MQASVVDDNGIKYIARADGTSGNGITVEVVSGSADEVVVVGNAITVTLNDAEVSATSTITQGDDEITLTAEAIAEEGNGIIVKLVKRESLASLPLSSTASAQSEEITVYLEIDGSTDVLANFTTALPGTNNDLVFTSKLGGPIGNTIQVSYSDPVEETAETVAQIVGNRVIRVYLAATGSPGSFVITSTAAQVKAAIEANFETNNLVTVANAAANDGTGVVTTTSFTLANGTFASAVSTVQQVIDEINGNADNTFVVASLTDGDGTEVVSSSKSTITSGGITRNPTNGELGGLINQDEDAKLLVYADVYPSISGGRVIYTGFPVTLEGGHIEVDDDATGVVSQQAGARGRLMTQLASASLYNPRILFLGDSLSNGLITNAKPAIINKFGAIESEGPKGNIGVTLAGGATSATDQNYWATAIETIPSGGSAEYKIDTVAQVESLGVVVYYVKEVGAGTFKAQVSNNGGAYADVGSTVDADDALAGGVQSFTFPLRGLNSVKIVGVTGTVKIIGVRYFNTDRAGAQISSISEGGSSISGLLQTPVAILNPIIADLAPDVVIWQMAESETSITNDLPTLYSRVNTAAGYSPDWVLMSTYTQGASYDLERSAVRGFAGSEGQIFIDASEIINAENGLLSGDGVHPSGTGSAVLASRLMTLPPFAEAPDKWGTANPTDNVKVNTFIASQLMREPLIRPMMDSCVSASSTANTSVTKTGGILQLRVEGTAVTGNNQRAILQGRVFSAPEQGIGTHFTQPVGFALSWTGILRDNITARVFIGADGLDLSSKGFGLEFTNDGTAKLIAHDGTTRVASAGFGMFSYASPGRNFLVWCENGMVHCTFASNDGFGTTRTISLAGGPTTNASDGHDKLMATFDILADQAPNSSNMTIHKATVFTKVNVLP